MIYVASPYTHDDPVVVDARYIATKKYVARLFKEKVWVFSPIIHCHSLALEFNFPTDASYWKEYNLHMLVRADALHVLELNDWKKSEGVYNEIFFWNALKHEAIVTLAHPTSRNKRLYQADALLALMTVYETPPEAT